MHQIPGWRQNEESSQKQTQKKKFIYKPNVQKAFCESCDVYSAISNDFWIERSLEMQQWVYKWPPGGSILLWFLYFPPRVLLLLHFLSWISHRPSSDAVWDGLTEWLSAFSNPYHPSAPVSLSPCTLGPLRSARPLEVPARTAGWQCRCLHSPLPSLPLGPRWGLREDSTKVQKRQIHAYSSKTFAQLPFMLHLKITHNKKQTKKCIL